MARVRVIDSHTGGEPTRVVISGGPNLPGKSMCERLRQLRENHDYLRTSVINEPRGSEIIVGALLCEPENSSNTAGIIFFNNVGYLGMCVHGTIGVAVTLAHLGRIQSGLHRIESPVGVVTAVLHNDNEVTVENVASYRLASNVTVHVPDFGTMKGDVAWGGNWFFLINESPIPLAIENSRRLTDIASATRRCLAQQGITGAAGAEIDHIEFFTPSSLPGVDSKNFVLCPGDVYDRSPCGTGTSAKLACLYADGKLQPGQIWRQESIVGSVFEGSIRLDGNQLFPSIKGSAFITSEADLILDSRDPFRHGLVP
ncbi:MAG: 4-hydroxyproline epimerase [Candidatus Acidiferrum sp.]